MRNRTKPNFTDALLNYSLALLGPAPHGYTVPLLHRARHGVSFAPRFAPVPGLAFALQRLAIGYLAFTKQRVPRLHPCLTIPCSEIRYRHFATTHLATAELLCNLPRAAQRRFTLLCPCYAGPNIRSFAFA